MIYIQGGPKVGLQYIVYCIPTFGPPCIFLISNFRRILNVVCFLLGNSPRVQILYSDVSEHCLFHFNRRISYTYPPMKMEQTECSETSAHKIQTPGNYPEESIQHLRMFLKKTR